MGGASPTKGKIVLSVSHNFIFDPIECRYVLSNPQLIYYKGVTVPFYIGLLLQWFVNYLQFSSYHFFLYGTAEKLEQ